MKSMSASSMSRSSAGWVVAASTLTLYENTAITDVAYGDKIVLSHAGGRIVADQLILANNAFGARFGFLQRKVLPMYLYASLSRPLPLPSRRSLVASRSGA